MDAEALADLFGPLGPIRTRKMFGGLGVWRGEAMFALVAFDRVWMKADAALAKRYRAAGSEPFVYAGKRRPVTMSFWSLPEDALDDPDAAVAWARLSLAPGVGADAPAAAAGEAGRAALSRGARNNRGRPAMARRRLIAGNWKMNGLRGSATEFDRMVEAAPDMPCDLLVCPPATLIATLAGRAAGGALAVGGQDCHPKASGAHTGDLSAEMLADAGAKAVIVGHSERRADHGESDALVAAKAEAAWRAGLTAVICVGETEAERDSGDTLTILADQIDRSAPPTALAENTVIAYEPVWAIGSGRTPTVEQIDEVHAFLRKRLQERLGDVQGLGMRLLYGGSVKPANAAEIFSVRDVDGALVGGASLKAADFLGIAAEA